MRRPRIRAEIERERREREREERLADRYDSRRDVYEGMPYGYGFNPRRRLRRNGDVVHIGSRGLQPLQRFPVLPSRGYYMGASDSPQFILVTYTDPDWIHYSTYPYAEVRKVRRQEGEHLIHTGMRNQLRKLEALAGSAFDVPEWRQRQIDQIREIMADGGQAQDLAEYQQLEFVLDHVGSARDPWRAAEQYGNVSSFEGPDGVTYYQVTGSRSDMMEADRDPDFDVISVTELYPELYIGQMADPAPRVAERDAEAIAPSETIEVGQTWENGRVRIHRYESSLRIWDLTNAGKRGKRVREASIDGYRDRDQLERLSGALRRMEVRSFDEAVDVAQDFDLPIRVTEDTKGVHVAPAGVGPSGEIEIQGESVGVKAGPTGFSVTDLTDYYNQMTIMDRGKRSAAKFFKWAQANRSALRDMDYREVKAALREAAIPYHEFAAMD